MGAASQALAAPGCWAGPAGDAFPRQLSGPAWPCCCPDCWSPENLLEVFWAYASACGWAGPAPGFLPSQWARSPCSRSPSASGFNGLSRAGSLSSCSRLWPVLLVQSLWVRSLLWAQHRVALPGQGVSWKPLSAGGQTWNWLMLNWEAAAPGPPRAGAGLPEESAQALSWLWGHSVCPCWPRDAQGANGTWGTCISLRASVPLGRPGPPSKPHPVMRFGRSV